MDDLKSKRERISLIERLSSSATPTLFPQRPNHPRYAGILCPTLHNVANPFIRWYGQPRENTHGKGPFGAGNGHRNYRSGFGFGRFNRGSRHERRIWRLLRIVTVFAGTQRRPLQHADTADPAARRVWVGLVMDAVDSTAHATLNSIPDVSVLTPVPHPSLISLTVQAGPPVPMGDGQIFSHVMEVMPVQGSSR